MVSYAVNQRGVAQARRLIRADQIVLNSNWRRATRIVYGDFRRLHRNGLIARLYRAAE